MNAIEEIEKVKEEFSKDLIGIETLEDEVTFWLSVEECEVCVHGQMCSVHYTRYTGR